MSASKFAARRALLVGGAAGIGALLLSGPVFAATPTPAPSGATSPRDRDDWVWGKRLQGQPSNFEAGGTDGYYIWHGFDSTGYHGLHLRTTDSQGRFRYTGELRSDGVFGNVRLVRAESDDHYELDDNGHVLKFSFVTYEGIDGLDFQVDGGLFVRFALDRDGHLIDPASIFLGEDAVHPDHNPFDIRRHHVPDKGSTTKAKPRATTTSAAG